MKRGTFSPVSDDSSDDDSGGYAAPCPPPEPGEKGYRNGDPVWCSKEEWKDLPPWPAKVDEADEVLECHFFEVGIQLLHTHFIHLRASYLLH